MKKKWGKGSKVEFWGLCSGLNSVKIDPKIFKNNNHVGNSIPDGRPRKNKNYETSGVLFTGYFENSEYSE